VRRIEAGNYYFFNKLSRFLAVQTTLRSANRIVAHRGIIFRKETMID